LEAANKITADTDRKKNKPFIAHLWAVALHAPMLPPALVVLAALLAIVLCIALDARRRRPDAVVAPPIPPRANMGILHQGAGV
jgi:hypothetical protein